jgi:hypothetical protein
VIGIKPRLRIRCGIEPNSRWPEHCCIAFIGGVALVSLYLRLLFDIYEPIHRKGSTQDLMVNGIAVAERHADVNKELAAVL